jgi:hypothetical protein
MAYDKRNNLFMGRLERLLCFFFSNIINPVFRCTINLAQFEREITHQRWFELEDGAGSILLLLSISGTATTDTVVDLTDSVGSDGRLGLAAKYVCRVDIFRIN